MTGLSYAEIIERQATPNRRPLSQKDQKWIRQLEAELAVLRAKQRRGSDVPATSSERVRP